MSIGKWIVVSFIVFAAFIATLVTVCMRQDISLVSKDYYKEELKYGEQITRLNNTAALVEKPAITLVSNELQVAYSDFDSIDNGEVNLFCPSNDKMDRRFELKTTTELIQTFRLDELQKGMYKARMLWSMNGQQFYHEEIIYL